MSLSAEFHSSTVAFPTTSAPSVAHFDCDDYNHSAVAAMGVLLQHHRIGWSHIPKTDNNTPENDTFMATIAQWLRNPSQCSADHLLQSLQRAGLQCKGFSEGCANTLITLLQTELSQQRPVLALTQGNPEHNEPHTVWRVLYHFNPQDKSIYTHNPFNATQRLVWSFEEWLQKLTGQPHSTNKHPNTALHYTVLIAYKPSQPRLFVSKQNGS